MACHALCLAAAICLHAFTAEAQNATKLRLRLGIGTFLSHDRGWNYGEPIEFFAGLARRTGSVDIEANASVSKSFTRFAKPTDDPARASAYLDGFRAGLGIRIPGRSRSFLSALLGAGVVGNRTEGEAHTATVAGTVGVGLNFGPERRGSVDLRYVRFAKRLGSSRGLLPLTLAWQL